MPEYLKKTKTPQIVEVVIKKVFDEKSSQYGLSKTAAVLFNGVEYYESFKPKKYHLLKEGSTLLSTRKMYDGKPYFEWYSKDENAEAFGAISTPTENEDKQKVQAEEKDEYQDKVSRGASWNNAFMYCLKYSQTKDIDRLCDEVSITAEKITKHQSKFVNQQ